MTMPPHPVAGCILEMLVLLVTTLHQSGKCVIVEVVVTALLFPVAIFAFVLLCEAAFAILVIKNTCGVSIRRFDQVRIVCLDVTNFSRCHAVTTRYAEAYRIKAVSVSQRVAHETRSNYPPGSARPLVPPQGGAAEGGKLRHSKRAL